jgi:transporter family protein
MWFLYALLSGLFAAILAIVVKLYLSHLDPLFIALFFSIVGVVFLLAMGLVTQKINCSLITTLSYKELLSLLVGGLLNIVAFTLYVTALKGGKTSTVVALDRIGIVFAVVFSVLFLQESFKAISIAGALFMVIGVFFLTC